MPSRANLTSTPHFSFISFSISQGLSFNVNYTFANSMSYTNQGDLLLPASVQDIYNVKADKGPVNSDIRHRFVTDFIYELPFAKLSASDSRASRLLLRGWQIGGVLTAQTGSPVNVTQPSALVSSRPDYIGGKPTFDNATETLVGINKAAFALVPIGEVSGVPIRPGNVGRNALRALGMWNLDLSLSKALLLTESMKLKFTADMLNSFNHTNLSSLESRITRSSFGRYRGTRGARVVQLGLRLTF